MNTQSTYKVAACKVPEALIGGPYTVIVLKDGRHASSTTGIQSEKRAEELAREYANWYGVNYEHA